MGTLRVAPLSPDKSFSSLTGLALVATPSPSKRSSFFVTDASLPDVRTECRFRFLGFRIEAVFVSPPSACTSPLFSN